MPSSKARRPNGFGNDVRNAGSSRNGSAASNVASTGLPKPKACARARFDEVLAATVIQRPSVGGAQQGVAIGKVEGGEGPAGVLQGRAVERIDQPRGGDGGRRLLGGRAGASAIGVAEGQHDAATEAARHGLGGKLRDRVLLLARQQRQQVGPDGKAGHAQDRQVDGGRGDDREPERRQDARHGRLAVSSSSLASASSGARDGACWLNSMRSQSPLVRITSTELT